MAVETTYSRLRQNLAATLDQVADDQEVVIVRRRGGNAEGNRDVALIPAAELGGLLETAHLLRSPKNAQRLLTSFRRAEQRQGKPQSVDALRKALGLESK
ncbi:MAG: type II toxin-antitoxin system Phd/YefM family antitoxin [Acidobacteriota bacterium]